MRISDWSSDVCSSDLSRQGKLYLLLPQQAGVFRGRGGHTRSCLHIRDVLLDDPSHTGGDREEGASGAAASASDELSRDRRAGCESSQAHRGDRQHAMDTRSEENTSELQSLMRNSY